MKSKLLITAVLLCPLFTCAQFTLRGKVVSAENREDLPGAIVFLSGSVHHTTSGENGDFILKSIPIGDYRLKINYLGFRQFDREIRIQADTSMLIELIPDPILSEEVVIRTSRHPVQQSASLTQMHKAEIEQRNTALDLPYLIEFIPSSVTTSDAGTGIGYTGIRIRGTNATRINVTLNGIPFNDPESQEVYWVDIPDIASSVDNIEVQRGVGTSANGVSSFGASINIQSQKAGAVPYASFSTYTGSFRTQKNSLQFGTGIIKDHLSIDGRASVISSCGYIDRASSELNSVFISANWFERKSLIKLVAFRGEEETYQAWDGVPGEILDTNRTFNVNGIYYDTSGNVKFYDNEIDHYRQDHLHLIFAHQFSRNTGIDMAVHYTHGNGYYEQYKQDEDGSDYLLTPSDSSNPATDLIRRKYLDNDFTGFAGSLNHKSGRLQLSAGGAVNQYTGNHFGKVIWTSQAFVQPTYNHEWYRNQGIKKEYNFYGKGKYRTGKNLITLVDLQFRHIEYSIKGPDDDHRDLTQHHTFDFFSPKAGIYYEINRGQLVELSAGLANREPNRSNFKDADPGRMPKAEQLLDIEAAYTLKLKESRLMINLFWMDYKDQLVLTGEINNVGAPVMTNVESSFRTGIELSWKIAPLARLTWEGNFSLSRNKIRNFTELIDNWEDGSQLHINHHMTDLSFSPAIIGAMNIEYLFPFNLKTSLSIKYVDKQYIDNTSSDDRMLDPYLVNGLRIEYLTKLKGLEQLSIHLSVNNLFAEEYETNAWVYRYYDQDEFHKMDGFFPQAGRNYLAGITVKL